MLLDVVQRARFQVWLRAETFTVFVLSRIIGGLSKANVNVATAIVTDVYNSEDNPKGMVGYLAHIRLLFLNRCIKHKTSHVWPYT